MSEQRLHQFLSGKTAAYAEPAISLHSILSGTVKHAAADDSTKKPQEDAPRQMKYRVGRQALLSGITGALLGGGAGAVNAVINDHTPLTTLGVTAAGAGLGGLLGAASGAGKALILNQYPITQVAKDKYTGREYIAHNTKRHMLLSGLIGALGGAGYGALTGSMHPRYAPLPGAAIGAGLGALGGAGIGAAGGLVSSLVNNYVAAPLTVTKKKNEHGETEIQRELVQGLGNDAVHHPLTVAVPHFSALDTGLYNLVRPNYV